MEYGSAESLRDQEVFCREFFFACEGPKRMITRDWTNIVYPGHLLCDTRSHNTVYIHNFFDMFGIIDHLKAALLAETWVRFASLSYGWISTNPAQISQYPATELNWTEIPEFPRNLPPRFWTSDDIPQKFNIGTQNSCTWKGLHFPNHHFGYLCYFLEVYRVSMEIIPMAFKSIHCSPGLKLVFVRLWKHHVGRYEDYLVFAERTCCVFVGFGIWLMSCFEPSLAPPSTTVKPWMLDA